MESGKTLRGRIEKAGTLKNDRRRRPWGFGGSHSWPKPEH